MARKEKTEKTEKAEKTKSEKTKPEKTTKAEKTKESAAPAKPEAPRVNEPHAKPRLQKYYEDRVRPKLMEQFSFDNPFRVPRIEKIVLNVGLGEAPKNPKLLESIVAEMTQIAGQKPLVTRARKAISNFGLRQGMPIGASVTLRGARMYEFLDRFVNAAVPRIRDFRGLPTRSFDGRGNYSLGVKEQMIFPEIDYDKVQKVHGMDIVFVTTTNKDDEAYALLRELGMPFRGETPVQVSSQMEGSAAAV
jgi:large subunit ribosomal protein L5